MFYITLGILNHISGEIVGVHASSTIDRGFVVSMHASSTIDRGFELPTGKTQDYKTDICCFSDKHAALGGRGKGRLDRHQDTVSKWRDTSRHRLLFK